MKNSPPLVVRGSWLLPPWIRALTSRSILLIVAFFGFIVALQVLLSKTSRWIRDKSVGEVIWKGKGSFTLTPSFLEGKVESEVSKITIGEGGIEITFKKFFNPYSLITSSSSYFVPWDNVSSYEERGGGALTVFAETPPLPIDYVISRIKGDRQKKLIIAQANIIVENEEEYGRILSIIREKT